MSNSSLRPASEIAAEVVPEPRENSLRFWEFWIKGGANNEDAVVVEDYSTKAGAELDADVVRGVVARLIEQARYDGAVEALREAEMRIKRAVPGQAGVFAEGLSGAARIVRELLERPRRS